MFTVFLWAMQQGATLVFAPHSAYARSIASLSGGVLWTNLGIILFFARIRGPTGICCGASLYSP